MKNSFLKAIIDVLKGDTETTTYRNPILYYLLKADVLYRRVFRGVPLTETLLVVVPKTLRRFVLEKAHDAIMGGHLGVSRTYQQIHGRYWWPGCLEDVTCYVSSCDECQRKKKGPGQPGGYLQPLLVSTPFLRVHFDYSGPYTLSKRRNQYLLLAICPISKYIMLRAVSAATALNAAKFML
jgi:hypothetical protein